MALRKTMRVLWWLLRLTFVSHVMGLPAPPSVASYDVLIVGGGPAGLATAMSLGRVGRSALLFDSAEYRNAATLEMHDVIGFDGVAPAAFRALAREQIERYPTITMINATITFISGQDDEDKSVGSFVAKATDGVSYSGRRVVVATGMRDVLPATPGLKEIWGKGIYFCSWCDGFEYRHKPFGNLVQFNAGSINGSISLAQTIDPDMIILSNGTFTPKAKAKADQDLPDWTKRLQLYNITVEDKIIKNFGRVRGNLSDYHDDILITFEDGTTLVRTSIKASFPAELAGDLPRRMGLNLTEASDHERKVQVNTKMETSVNGVYTVGDANSDGSSNVPHALWSAKRAVVSIHGSLGSDYADEAVSKHSLHARRLSVDETFDATNTKLRRLSKDTRSVARQWIEWLEQ